MTQSFRDKPWNELPGMQLQGVAGADLSVRVLVTDSTGATGDMTQPGWSSRVSLRKRPSAGTDVSPLPTVALGPDGYATLSLTAAQTTSLVTSDERRLFFELFVTDPAGTVSRQAWGTLDISL